jgi:hypothetical protein
MRVRAQNLRWAGRKVTLESEVAGLFPETTSNLEDDVKCYSTSNQADGHVSRQVFQPSLVDVVAQRVDARL